MILAVQAGFAASGVPITSISEARGIAWDGMSAMPVVNGPVQPVMVQPPEGLLVDSGYYDYQENGSVPKRIVITPGGAMHLVWFSSPDFDAGYPNRNCWYYYAAAGSDPAKQGEVSLTRSGFPSLDILPDFLGAGAAAVIGNHSSDQPSGVLTSTLFTDAFEGLGAFSPHYDNMQDNTGDDYSLIWPKIGVNPTNAGVTVGANQFAGGPDTQWMSYLSPDSIVTGNMQAWYDLTPDLNIFNDNTVEWPSIATYDDGTVGVLVGDIGGDMRLYESPTGDFSLEDFTMTNLTNFDNTLLDTVDFGGSGDVDTTKLGFRPWETADFIYDINGTPHAVWAEGRAAVNLSSDQVSLFAGLTVGGEPWGLNYRIQHWDPNTGVSTVYTSTRHSQDSVAVPVNTLPTSYPTIGVSDDNSTLYVVFQEMRDEWRDDAPLDFGFGELFCVAADNGDTNWTLSENMVNCSNAPLMDDRYPSVARVNSGGQVHLMYVSDPEGSNFAFTGGGEEAPITWVYLMYNAFDPPPPATGIEDGGEKSSPIPKATALMQNYPNPFNPQTTIRYSLAEDSNVLLTIHNLRGEVVTTLVNTSQSNGDHAVTWDGHNERGESVSSGIYFYRLKLDNGSSVTKKMVLLK